jgi:2-polyprenyl-3-methyl-5-hydroxy-6-metoxy-1,4-benzoquinol methylase
MIFSKEITVEIQQIRHLINEIILDYEKEPIDLLNINDAAGEITYMRLLEYEYVRTVHNIVKHVPPSSTVKVFEIGTFLGVVSIALAKLGYQVYATDIPEFLDNFRLQQKLERWGIQYSSINLSKYELPFADASFDVVIMCEVIEHLNFNPLPVVAEINRILSQNGLFYLALPNLASLRNRLRLLRGKSVHNPISDYFRQLDATCNMIVGLHWREYTHQEIREMLESLGFVMQQQSYCSSVDGGTSRPSQLLKRAIYTVFPSFKEGQINIATKASSICPEFTFTDATQPT